MAKAIKTVAMVVAGAALIATGIGAALGGTMVFAAFGVTVAASTIATVAGGIAAVASLFAIKKPQIPESQVSRLTASINPREYRKTVLGSTAMATDIRYEEWFSTNQERCGWIIALASHKIDGVDEIWLNDEMAWSATGGVTTKFSGYFLVQAIRTEGNAGNTVTFGSGQWNSSRRLTGCAYAWLEFKVTGNTSTAQSPFSSGIPTRITIIGRGAPLYDPRRDSTVPGGSGSMRANDQTTWRYTTDDSVTIGENVALQILRVLIGGRINGKLATGCGVPLNRLDMPSFLLAANQCDELVTKAGGGTEPRFRAAGVISEGDDPGTILNALCAACCGRLSDVGGKLALLITHNDLAEAALDDGLNDDDVIGAFQWNPDPSLEATPNVVRGSYVDASTKSLYQLVPYPDVTLATGLVGEIVMPLDLGFVESASQCQRIAKQALQRRQYDRSFTAPFDIRAWKYRVGQVVPFTFAALGFDRRLFRVVEQDPSTPNQCVMTLREESADIYAWDAEESPPVQVADPIVYDSRNNPLILAIDEAATTAIWADITGTGKPEDGATRNNPRGNYDPAATYYPGDLILWALLDGGDGTSYVRIGTGPTTGVDPTDATKWVKLVERGPEGPPGDPGPTGFALDAQLSRGSARVPAFADGTVANYTGAQAQFVIIDPGAALDVSSDFTLSVGANPQGLTVSINNTTKTFTITAGLDAGEDSAQLTLLMTGSGTYAGITISRTFSLEKLITGYQIVSALPTTTLFEGRIVYNTGDGKLYKYTSGAWVAMVDLDTAVSNIADGAINTAKFAAGIEPVSIVSSLPGTLTTMAVLNTADDKLYRWDGSAYVATVPSADITGTLTNAQIASLAASKITGTLTNAQIADLAATKITGTLTDAQIAALAAAKLTGQITTTQITDDAVTTAKIAAGSVTAAEIAADTITAAQIAANAISTAELSAGAVTTAKIAADAVTANEIAANAVTAAEIAAGAVITAKIAAGAVTAAEIAAHTITAGQIAAGTITATEIATDTITAAQIAADTITAGEIAAGAISTSELAAGAVTAAKIAAGTITANEIAANTITAAKIAAGTITANEIQSGAITTAKIAAGAVTAAEIQAGTIVATKFLTDQGVDLAAIVPGSLNFRINFSDTTDLGPYSANMDTGIIAISGTGSVTTTSVISTAPAQTTSEASNSGAPTTTTLSAYYRINGGSWILLGTQTCSAVNGSAYNNNDSIPDASPVSSGTIQFGYRLSATYSGLGTYTSLDRALLFEVVNWK